MRICRTGPLALVLVTVLASGCVSPSRTDRDYQLKAGNTAKAAASSVATALLGADLGGEQKATGPFLSVLLRNAEEDTSSVQNTFDSVQPPSRASDQLRSAVDQVLADALDGLAKLRIAVRRGQVSALPTIAQPLHKTLTQLQDLADRYQ